MGENENDLQNKLSITETKLKKLTQVFEDEKEKNLNMTTMLNRLNEEVDLLRSSSEVLESEKNRIEKELQEALNRIHQLEPKLEYVTKQKVQIEKDLTEANNTLEKHKLESQALHRQVTEHLRTIDTANKKLEEKENALERIKVENAMLTKENEGLNENITRLHGILDSLQR